MKKQNSQSSGSLHRSPKTSIQAEGDIKIQYQNHIEELRKNYAFAQEKTEILVNSSENARESFKADVESAYEALTEAVHRLLPD